MKLAEGQRPAEQGAQLEVDEDAVDGKQRIAGRVVQFEAVDPETEHERIDRDLLQPEFDAQVVTNGIRGGVLHEPGCQEETEQCVHDDRGGGDGERFAVTLRNHLA